MKQLYSKIPALVLTLIVGLMATSTAFGTATIIIQNNDPAGVGFNDTTPVAPVGGNPGTTVGEQRLRAFEFAASIWGATLTSGQTITIRAGWPVQFCTEDEATLGSAGATSAISDFPGAPFTGTQYSIALANALSNSDFNGGNAEITANFNRNIGTPGCLEGSHWYYGLDTNAGPGGINLVTVLLHEFAHGLGFQTFTNRSSGVQAGGLPSIYDRFLFDNSIGKTWPQMTDGERAASAVNTNNLVWNGPRVLSDVAGVLGSPRLRINSPPAIAGNYEVGTAEFGAKLVSTGVTANVVQALDPSDSAGTATTDGCSPLTNAAEVSGKIALIDRGTCTFIVKVKNAQNAGAVGVLIVHNEPGSPPALGGSDPTITIPAVRISQADGNSIKGQLMSVVNATLLFDGSAPGGADGAGRPRMYTPNPLEGGSSVAHWDTSLFPNQLMEPNISSDLSHSVRAPQDLTFSLMRDIGWLSSLMDQSIDFGVLPNKTFGDPPFTVSATATSGLPVTFSIVSGPATISGNTITLTGTGVVTVRASQPGNATFTAAPAIVQSFTVVAGSFQPVVLTVDQVEIKTWTFQGRTYAYVKLSFPNAGYRVFNWGQPVAAGNDFSADALVEKFTGASVQAVTTTAQIYDLGVVADGNYTFTFKNSGTVVKSQPFTVSSATPSPNPIDIAREFVKQQYRDFLNREADQAGEDFWTDNITKCSDPARRPPGQTEAQCTLRQRETTSGAFFVSPEFSYTGYYVYRLYVGALGRRPKLSEFTPDALFVGNGIVVNGQLSGQKINENKAALAQQFVNCTDAAKYRCAEFKAIYDGLNNTQYVNKLFETTGVNASATDRQALVDELTANPTTGRGSVLAKVVDGINVISEGNEQFLTTYGEAFYNSEFNEAFVQLEYFGYMRRDPDDDGYAFWLAKLNLFGGNFVNAEMVLAFISSPEYRARFGPP